jgi:subtilisin family serine protease
MAAKRKASGRTFRGSRRAGTPASPPRLVTPRRELVVVMKEAVGLRTTTGALTSVRGASVASLAKVLQKYRASLRPTFGNEDRVSRALANAPAAARGEVPDLTRFYHVDASDDQLEALCAAFLNDPAVDGAYVKPTASLPVAVRRMASPSPLPAPPVTPTFVANQTYLDAAPGGINARFAWMRPGGRGRDVRIIDIEGAWRFSHEDMLLNQGGVIGGEQTTDIDWRNHGTAVIGVIGADDNTVGVTGIAPDANVRAISIFSPSANQARAITDAANALGNGDIILIEQHNAGPRHRFAERQDQLGYIAVEWWPENLAAIQYATQVRGVIVIEAAGNGAENLDDALYDTRPSNFPTDWRNPFNLANRQSGAIVVGAGAPPPGTHGRNHGVDRSRLDFSNFGARVDVQGWGEEVTTCGYGDLQMGSDEDLWYTDTFAGTSSASPIVVGAVACLQGGLLARGRAPLTPAAARDLLRRTGSPQQDERGRPATQRIGNRPDLASAFSELGLNLVKDELADKDVRDREKIKDAKEKDKSEKETIKDLGEDKPHEKIKETKETKDVKDVKDKDFKDKEKEVKERAKEGKEGPDLMSIEPLLPPSGAAGDRLARLEQTVANLAHFIQAGDRPDLRRSALSGEADQAERLAGQASAAKRLKDAKDVEKGREF